MLLFEHCIYEKINWLQLDYDSIRYGIVAIFV